MKPILGDRYGRTPTHSYVGFGPCGCAWAICLDLGDKGTGQDVYDMIVNGRTVQRYPNDEAQALFRTGLKCNHKPEDIKGPLL